MKYYAFEMNERLTCDLLFDGQCSTHNCLGRSCEGILYHRPSYCPLSEFVDINPEIKPVQYEMDYPVKIFGGKNDK